MQRTREAFVNGLPDSISDDYDRGLSPQWVALLDRVLAPHPYPGHGLQMVAAYIGNMAPSSTYHDRRHLPGRGRNAARPAAR